MCTVLDAAVTVAFAIPVDTGLSCILMGTILQDPLVILRKVLAKKKPIWKKKITVPLTFQFCSIEEEDKIQH